jgi:hypothetical protein
MTYVVLMGVPLMLIFSYVDGSKRGGALLLFSYIVLTPLLYRIVRSLGRSLKAQIPSAFPKATKGRPPLLVPPAFDKVRDEILISTGNRRYFHKALKKRIIKVVGRRLGGQFSGSIPPDQLGLLLGEKLGGAFSEDDEGSMGRITLPLLRRGVSLREISDILHRIEGLG